MHLAMQRAYVVRVLSLTAMAAAGFILSPGVAAASGYMFKQIVDNTGYNFTTLGSSHRQLNDSGEVVFQASTQLQNFVFKGSGGNLTTNAGPPTFFGLNSGFGNGAIADNGSVVFTGTVSGSQGEIRNGIYVDNAGTKTPLITSDADPNTNLPERLFYAASTSSSGVRDIYYVGHDRARRQRRRSGGIYHERGII
jgi:hypothetical protein